jgi:hypothetical protein
MMVHLRQYVKTKIMNRIITLFLGLFLTVTTFAQQKVDYDNDSRWFWGINLGSTWTSADVAKKNDWAWGLTLGKSFNYNYGRALSFDLRGRFLTGEWYGQNTDTTDISGISPYNQTGTDYSSAYGYAVLNHQVRLTELSLELVIHANGLRARTGWDPYIFGGIGYNWYTTRTNLIDNTTGNLYTYDDMLANNQLSKTALFNTIDGDYETTLNNGRIGAFMPSLGFGLGYQFKPRFSMGLEHRTTFTLTDDFDGYVNAAGKYPNDWYHYTGVYMRFQVRDHANTTTTDNTNSLNQVTNYDQAQNNLPPTVDFTNPAVTGTTVSSANYVIRAMIKNVPGSNNVIFRQNGNYNTNFTFNPSTQSFESIVTLVPGQNVFELTGTNNFGSDQEQTVIIYNRETPTPPVVSYINPASSPATVQTPVYNLVASVLNVSQQAQVTLTLNGQSIPNFTFNNSTNHVTASLNLQVGTNIVTTTGTNVYGTDQESITIIYNPVQTEQPPVVYFVDPQLNPYTTTSNTFVINADVLNVAGSQNITFKQNGTVNQNFTYNAQTDDFQSTVVLNAGQNVFEITGSNAAGIAQASTIIILNRPAPKPPIVTITAPEINPKEVNNATYNLASTVLNVTQASQIVVKLNGQSIPFNYNNATNAVSATLNLVQGTNTVQVTGTNADGTDAKTTTLIYRPAQTIQPPVVQFTTPNVDPFTVNQPGFNAIASVLNVPTITGVNVNVNGMNVTNFTFVNSIVSLPLTLIEGANVITITGTNTAGTDSEVQTIIYTKPAVAQPPVVSFIDPVLNPTTVYSSTYNVRARVRYVSSAAQITLQINGQNSTNFTYSPSSEMMEFTTALVPGANSIVITAANADGQDQAATTIIYKLPNPAIPPVVTITNPVANPYTTATALTTIAATVLNVDGAQSIQVSLNGVNQSNFNYNMVTKQLSMNVTLIAGSNNLLITATNSVGTASDNRTLIYKREQVQNPPVVHFLNPATPGMTVAVPSFVMKATVLNVTMASQIVVMQDGQVVSPTLWSFNPSSAEVTMNTNLNVGNNIFAVTGSNVAGSNTASTNVIYKAPIVECIKPVIAFSMVGVTDAIVTNQAQVVMATVQNITSANQVQLLVNGILQSTGSFNNGNNQYVKPVQLTEGQNVIELIATNNCGTTSASFITTYQAPAAPCLPPLIQRLVPAMAEVIVELPTVEVQAAVTNVDQASQLVATVNGVQVPFNFDNATHLVTVSCNLVEGDNLVKITTTTSCGTRDVQWKITRKICVKPTISLTSSSVPSNAQTFANTIELVAVVSGVTSENEITVTLNTQPVGFVFNAQTGVLTVNSPLVIGNNSFTIKATNSCGTGFLKFGVVRKEQPTVNPPTVTITNPATSPYAISQSGMTIQVATTNITAANQLSVTVNGAQTNFNFNTASGVADFNASFQEGANIIVATVFNAAGTATDTKTVIYTAPVMVQPPVITLTSPAACPAAFPRGAQTFTGTVTNITNANQVSILYNNSNVNFTSTISGDVLSFSFVVNVNATTLAIPLIITATNAGGTDVENCAVSIIIGNSTDGGGTQSVPVDDPSRNNGGSGSGNRGNGTTPIVTHPAGTLKQPVKPAVAVPARP